LKSLHRQIVAIAFDEAEGLANQAVGVGEPMRPPQSKLFASEVEQIRRMKVDAESGSVQTDGGINGTVMTGA
jgi:hypothetical protein